MRKMPKKLLPLKAQRQRALRRIKQDLPPRPVWEAPPNRVKRDERTPFVPRTKFYDGFDGFTFPGAPPARNPHINNGQER